MKLRPHGFWLVAIVGLGTILRFWQLDSKPLWLDEVITALITLGRGYNDVPLDVAFPLSRLDQIFRLHPATCTQITQTLTQQSVHPPLFFCTLHTWLRGIDFLPGSLAWKVRSLPALLGVVLIAAVYWLNRVAFSPRAGLVGALAVAVSPFAVYLSQEARHYTLPMVLITLALVGLVGMQQDLYGGKFRPMIWLGWIAVNSLGFYVHYFFLLAFAAQVISLGGWVLLQRVRSPRSWGAIVLAVGGVGLSYLPWVPTLLSHMNRPETDWLKSSAPEWARLLAPLYQLAAGWVLMVVALPVENQPLGIAIPSVLGMVFVAAWLGSFVLGGLRQLWHLPQTRLLIGFLLVVLLEFLAIVYLLGKDITIVPRYNFVYYPAVAALLGATLSSPSSQPSPSSSRTLPLLFSAGCLSCLFLLSGLVFQKPYYPRQVAAHLHGEPTLPLITVMGYEDLQDVALGLSFALELPPPSPETTPISLAFLTRSQGYDPLWQNLSTLKQVDPAGAIASPTLQPPLNLWVIAPGLKRNAFPKALTVSEASKSCPIDPSQYHRIGIPYQLYRCR